MYGSLTTIMLIMMWTYTCMYTLFLGAEINKIIEMFKNNSNSYLRNNNNFFARMGSESEERAFYNKRPNGRFFNNANILYI